MATLVTMDEVERSFRFPPTLLAVLLVILGAWGYMRLGKSWQRMAALLACAGVSIVAMLASADYFWQTHAMNFSTGESRVLDVAVNFERLSSRALNGRDRPADSAGAAAVGAAALAVAAFRAAPLPRFNRRTRDPRGMNPNKREKKRCHA